MILMKFLSSFFVILFENEHFLTFLIFMDEFKHILMTELTALKGKFKIIAEHHITAENTQAFRNCLDQTQKRETRFCY